MITEIVLFDLPDGMTRGQAADGFRQNAPVWGANPELVRKNYLYDPATHQGGGAYLWPNIAAAQRAHDAAWCEMIEKRFGKKPVIRYFETPVVVDNVLHKIIDETTE
jgi:hypothetical protein